MAASLRLSSFRPTPGAPIKTNGLNTPGLGYNLHTSSYVAIISLSKSSFSSRSYIIFLVLVPGHMLFGFGEPGGVEQIDAHEPSTLIIRMIATTMRWLVSIKVQPIGK